MKLKFALAIILFFIALQFPLHASESLSISTNVRNNIALTGQPIQYTVTLNGYEGATVNGEMTIKDVNFFKQEDSYKLGEVTVYNGPIKTSGYSGMPPGYYKLTATLLFSGKTLKAETSFAVISPRASETGNPIFAINRGEPYILNLMGVNWVRMDISWPDIEKTKGVFDFSPYEQTVDNYVKNNIEIMGILNYTPDWAARLPDGYKAITSGPHKGWGAFPPRNINEWGDYVYKTVSHFKGRVKYWEIWNEPYPYSLFFNGGSIADYVEILKSTYTKGKEACPECVFIGLGGTNAGVAEQVFQSGGYPYMDAASIHIYQPGIAPESGNFRQMIKDTFTAMKKRGAVKPLWITESGWPTNKGVSEMWQGVSLEDQGRFLVRSMILAKAEGVDKFFWYAYQNAGGDIRNFEDNQGVLFHDGTPKPAFAAYAIMTNVLANAEFRALKVNGDKYLAMFSNDKDWIAVVWTTTGGEIKYDDRGGILGTTEFFNMMGDNRRIYSGITDYIYISKSPTYFIISKERTEKEITNSFNSIP